MKTTILLMAMLCSATVFSQKIDSVKVKEMESGLETFKPVIKDYSDKIGQSTDLANIKTLATNLEKQSDTLIAEVKATFKINDDYLIEYSNDLFFANTFPNLASFYQTQANLKLAEGMNQTKPNYYKNLIDINDFARQISKTKDLAKAKKLNDKIIKSYQELITIKSGK